MTQHTLGAALLTAAVASSVTWSVAAQPATVNAATPTSSSVAKRPDPLDPRVTVPSVQYRSARGAYRPNVEQPVGSWKDANDAAGRAGGWRAYAREANAPETSGTTGASAATPAMNAKPGAAAAKPAAAIPSAAKPDGHGGHKH